MVTDKVVDRDNVNCGNAFLDKLIVELNVSGDMGRTGRWVKLSRKSAFTESNDIGYWEGKEETDE